jgi:hypothetical protein
LQSLKDGFRAHKGSNVVKFSRKYRMQLSDYVNWKGKLFLIQKGIGIKRDGFFHNDADYGDEGDEGNDPDDEYDDDLNTVNTIPYLNIYPIKLLNKGVSADRF